MSYFIGAIPPPPLQGLSIGPLDVRMYGIVIALGAFLALRLTVQRYERFGGDGDTAEKAALFALLFGFLGARIGYVIPRFLGPGGFVERPGDILAIWQGGLAFFGGLTGGAIAVVLYVRLKRADLPAMLDAFAPALPLAQAIGRWGNYFNQELFGRPTGVAWALRVEPVPARTAQQFPGATTFHPTFLYESLWNAALVCVLLWIDRAGILKRRGSLLFIYLIGYGIGRAWIETLRVDTVERYLGLSRNNWIAIAVVLAGIVGLSWWENRSEDDEPEPTESNDEGQLEVSHDIAETIGRAAPTDPVADTISEPTGQSDVSEASDDADGSR